MSAGSLRRVAGGLITIAFAALVGILAYHTCRLDAEVVWLRQELGNLGDAVDSLEIARNQDISLPVSPLLLEYRLDLPGRGEVFPAMTLGEVPEYWPVAMLSVTNTSNRPVAQIVSAEIAGWSRRMEKTLLTPPRGTDKLSIQPELLTRAHRNTEIARAELAVRATGLDGAVLFAENREVLIHGGSEIYWGRQFANAQVAARWVTPHDRDVLELVSRARGFVRNGRMAGYSAATGGTIAISRHVRDQARAIYSALQKSGITYVSSKFVMGEFVDAAQRVRFPSETLHLKNANCMDVSVVFASAIENLGMQPVLVIVPGHAFAGVRTGKDSPTILYADLTVLPKGTFESATARAAEWLRKTPKDRVLVVDVAAARALGVYPRPSSDLSQIGS